MHTLFGYKSHRAFGVERFFRLTMAYQNIVNYYRTNFAMMHHHKYSLTEIENMAVYERDIYVSLLIQYLEKVENERAKNG